MTQAVLAIQVFVVKNSPMVGRTSLAGEHLYFLKSALPEIWTPMVFPENYSFLQSGTEQEVPDFSKNAHFHSRRPDKKNIADFL